MGPGTWLEMGLRERPAARIRQSPGCVARATRGNQWYHSPPGYIVAEFGDTKANDPVYSVAKSFLSTTASIAFAKGLIHNVDDRLADYIHDGGYDSPHNAKIT